MSHSASRLSILDSKDKLLVKGLHSAYVEPLQCLLFNTLNISVEKNSQWQLQFTAYDDGSLEFHMLSVEASVWWDGQEYIVKQFQEADTNGFTTYQVTAIHVAYDVQRVRQRQVKAGTLTYTVESVLSFYLAGNSFGYTWQVIGNFGKEKITDLGNSSGKDMLNKIVSTWPDAIFYPDNKNIRIYQHDSLAKNLGNRIDYLHNTPELKLTYDSSSIVNQVMASGKTKENSDGNSDKTEYYFEPFLVTDQASVNEWGLHPGDDVPDERFTDKDAMKTFALSQLTPQPTLVIDVSELGNEEPTLGEIRRLENRKDGFVTEVEVVAFTFYPLDNSQATSVTLNDQAKTILNYKSKQQSALQKSIQSMLNQQRGTINDLVNGMNRVNDNISSTNNHIYPWQDKSITAIGDSITYGWIENEDNDYNVTAPWTDQLSPMCKFAKVTNVGVGSSRIAKNDSQTVLSFSERVDGIQGQDFVALLGGINDFLFDNPLGLFMDTSITTFYGALDYIAKSIVKHNPNARVLWMTPMVECVKNQAMPWTYGRNNDGIMQKNNAGYTQKDYADAIIKVASYYSFTVLDLMNNCVINPIARDEMFRDGMHPNKEGYKALGEQIARQINIL